MPPWVDPLSRGDWAGFWSLFPISLNAEVKRHFELNDPKALAAERIGRIESAYMFDLDRVSELWCTAAEMTPRRRGAYRAGIEDRVTRDGGLRSLREFQGSR